LKLEDDERLSNFAFNVNVRHYDGVRVGRGRGSGKGKTSGRGSNGQNSRAGPCHRRRHHRARPILLKYHSLYRRPLLNPTPCIDIPY
jgi:hypothetical protein